MGKILSYGAFATAYFCLFNENVAATITNCGRELTQTMSEINQQYWHNEWHLDEELHKRLYIKNPIQIGSYEPSIYADTDSCDKDTVLITNIGKLTIEEFYNRNIINGSNGITTTGHESVKTNNTVLNYNGSLYQAPIKRIIRHKVSKQKWKLKTKSGKEVIITNDHSLIVFRNNVQIEVKPCDVLKTDKILIIKK